MVLWFEIDVIFVAFWTFAFFWMMKAPLPLNGLVSVLFAYLYNKAKKDAPRGFMFHLAYILCFASFQGFYTADVTRYQE